MSLAEMGLIILVTVIFIGPKELPVVIRTVSGWVRQLRGLMAEVKKGLEGIAQEAELGEIKEAVKQTSYIVDLEGQFRETYDISDIVKQGKPAAPHHVTPAHAGVSRNIPMETPGQARGDISHE